MFEILNYIFAGGIVFSHVIGYIVSIFAFLFIYKNWDTIKRDNIIICIVAFLVYGFVLACFCEYKKDSFEEMFTYLTSWLPPFILGYYITDNLKKEKTINIYIIVFTAVIAFSVLAYFGFFYEQIAGSRLAHRGKILNGLMWHISLGAMSILLSCFSLIHLLFKKNLSNKQKIILSALTVFFMVSLYLTSSRGYYIAGFITYLSIFVFYFYKTRKLKIPIIIFSLGLILVAVLFSNNEYMQKRIENTSITKEKNLTDRIEGCKTALAIIKHYPFFGVGPRQAVKQAEFYEITKLSKEDNSRHLHSMYLNIFAEFGIIGFIIFILMIFFIIKRLYLQYKQESSLLALCLLFAWMSLLIGDCFDTVLRGPRVAMDYFWLTGLILASEKKLKE
ncbi:O-antigen ligase family protein [Candidatus Ruminimicrobium bovinum]|uniref:O-antigen ligase family protein n=1 Tax=Candidatus Ruminimicrobium bovinum TaxID=3242779 RepID=UPI0039B9D006